MYPRLLWRYITGDLLRLIVLSATVLVAVIALGASVKPVSDGLLSAENFLKFIFYAIPPMLAYALPFAAGFAATLVYYRLSQDNEAVAAQAGGISHRSLLFPAACTGILLALTLAVLNEVLIPYFLYKMQRLITRDLATWVIQEINRGESVEMGGMMVHARSAERVAPALGSAATDVILMTHVAAIERDVTGRPTTEVTSERAWVIVFPWEGNNAAEEVSAADQGKSRIVMRLENFAGISEGRGAGGARDSADVAWSVPNPFRDNIKFLSWSAMRELEETPERMNWVDIWRKDLAFCVAERTTSAQLLEAINRDGTFSLLDDQGAEVVVSANRMEAQPGAGGVWKLTHSGGKQVEIRLPRHGTVPSPNDPILTLTAPAATLTVDIGKDRLYRSLSLRLDLTDVTVADSSSGQPTQRAVYRVSGLTTQNDVAAPLLELTSPKLLVVADEITRKLPATAEMSVAARDLTARIDRLKREVLAKTHERWVMVGSCCVLCLTGAITALRLSRKLPLTVYLFTFFPAVFCIVIMSGGQQLTSQIGTPGLLVMWSGVTLLAVYTFLQYRVLARN